MPDGEKDIYRKIEQIKQDIIIQRPVRQHPSLAQLNVSSVNTIRVMSFLTAGRRSNNIIKNREDWTGWKQGG